jgi:uncharacterized LabA/DUF88 family protein
MRVTVFVDGANMYHTQKKLGWYIDFRRLLSYLSRDGDSVGEAYYYTGLDPTQNGRDQAFYDYLIHSGYTIRSKNIKQIYDETSGDLFTKANMDVDITVDMLMSMSRYDTCILLSGDGDFEVALEAIRLYGKRIVVVSHYEMVAKELRACAGRNFLDISTLQTQIGRVDRSRILVQQRSESIPESFVPQDDSKDLLFE